MDIVTPLSLVDGRIRQDELASSEVDNLAVLCVLRLWWLIHRGVSRDRLLRRRLLVGELL